MKQAHPDELVRKAIEHAQARDWMLRLITPRGALPDMNEHEAAKPNCEA